MNDAYHLFPDLIYPLEDCRPESFSRQEIISAVAIAPKLQSQRPRRVARISTNLVVKYGRLVRLHEAKNMRYAGTNPSLRLPKVYDAWSVERPERHDKVTYILIDFIPGKIIADVWSTLDSDAQQAVYQEIKVMLDSLHQQPLKYPGPIDNENKMHGLQFTDYGAGPFRTASELEGWFNGRLQVCKDYNQIASDFPGFTGHFRKFVFCYMDLHSHNVILDEENRVWIVDWERAGGYPVYFEEAEVAVGLDIDQPEFKRGLSRVLSTGKYDAEIRHLWALLYALTTTAIWEPRQPDGTCRLRSDLEGE